MIRFRQRPGRWFASLVLVGAMTGPACAQEMFSQQPNMATVTTTHMAQQPLVFVRKIDNVQQDVRRTGFMNIFVSSDDQSYDVTPGLHLFEMAFTAGRTNYIYRARVLVGSGHRYKFYCDGEELKFQDVTLNMARDIPLHPEIMTGGLPPGQRPTIVINIIRPPANASQAAYASQELSSAPLPPVPPAPATYDQWVKLHPASKDASSEPH